MLPREPTDVHGPPQTLSAGCQLGIRRRRIQDLFLPDSIPGPRGGHILLRLQLLIAAPPPGHRFLLDFSTVFPYPQTSRVVTASNNCSFLDASPYFVASRRAAHLSVNSLFLEHYLVYPFERAKYFLLTPDHKQVTTFNKWILLLIIVLQSQEIGKHKGNHFIGHARHQTTFRFF